MTHPTEGESLKMWETEEGSMSLSGTFFWETTTAQFFPRTPTELMLAAVMALKAYSGTHKVRWCEVRGGKNDREEMCRIYLPTWYSRPWSEKMVMCRS